MLAHLQSLTQAHIQLCAAEVDTATTLKDASIDYSIDSKCKRSISRKYKQDGYQGAS